METVRARLEPLLAGRRLERVAILDPLLTRPEPPAAVAALLEGERVTGVRRRGKYLVVDLESGRHLVVHLRMTGSFRHGPGDDPHGRAVVELDDGGRLVYRDVRRFGTWSVLERDALDAYLGERLGPEPLGPAFTAAALGLALRGRRAPVKAALLDQRTVAGIGNIYADEALWHARVHPLCPAGELGKAEVARLARAIRRVLRTGIDRRGASLRDYRAPDGASGSMQDEFRVYGRAGAPCPRCGAAVVKLRVAGRGTSLCPDCQAAP